MTSLKRIIQEGRVAVGIEASDKAGALEAVAGLLCADSAPMDPKRLLSAIVAREALASTGIGEGIAIPHALCDDIHETSLAVARLARPVDFGAQDSVPVDLVFMIAGSRDNASQHLQLLSKLARMAHDPSFRKAAREAVDAPSLARLLRERE